MEANYEKLYTDLRKTSEELLNRMNNNEGSKEVQAIIKEELEDITIAMNKMSKGDYGKCEISGELIPIDLLQIMPTIKSLKDFECMNRFFRKPLNSI